MEDVVYSTETILFDFFSGMFVYIPQFLAGLVLLFIGFLVGNFIRRVVKGLSRFTILEKWLKKAKIGRHVDTKMWLSIVGEVLRWSVVILFLVAAVDAWGLTVVGDLLSELLFYLPNVFVAVVIGFIGLITSNLVSDLVKQGSKDLGSKSANMLSTLSRYAIRVFAGLMVLNQLGVAASLINILFTGLVAMLALAGGLAFGLGGKDAARDVLEDLRNKLK
ncbi:hypothetical protein ACFL1A_03220 [Patescibacteria group bacterium]